MDFAKAQYERIRKQLEGLTASQRMLTATLLVIMGITLVYWVKYAGKPEMEAVLEQSMSAEDVTRIKMKLEGMGVAYQVTGDRVLVPADKRTAVLTALSYDGALPSNTTAAWDAIVGKINPWNSEHQNAQWWAQAKMAKLAEVIRGWPGVADAKVFIDSTERRGFTNPVQPKATIDIRTRDGRRPDRKLIMAAADLVAGAQAGLDRSRVSVVVNGMSFPVHGPGEDSLGGADEIADARQKHEVYYADKIAKQLRWLNSEVFVTVAVDVNTKTTQEQSTTYDPKGTAKVETRTRTKANEESTEARPAGEPGVGANTQGSIADADGAGGPSQSRNDNEDETEYQSGLSKKELLEKEGPGRATVVAASVRVPHSYFVRVYKEANGATKDPDAATLAPYLEQELAKIRADVKSCTALTDDKAVAVETYADAILASAEAPASDKPSGGVGMMKDAVGGHGKEIALGALAVVSLFMMMMMVRKGTPAPVVAHIPEPQGPVPQLAAGEEVVGEAGDGETVLGGMELDEAAAQTQQMLGQVSDLVKENPDAAATLIKRWMNK